MNALIDKYRGRLAARYRGTGLEQGVRWWGRELHELAPAKLRTWFDYVPEYLLIVESEEGWLVFRAGGEHPGELERIRPDLEDAEASRERVQRMRESLEGDEPRCVYALPRDRALVKSLTLPAATEENLRQVLAYEMDRHTPFGAEQVYFDYRVLKRDAAQRTLDLRLVLTPKAALDEALKALGAAGFELDAVDVAAHDGMPPELLGVNLLPRERRVKRSYTQTRLNWALAAAALVLLVLAMWQSLALKDARIDKLQAKVEKARASAMEVAAQRKELEEAVAGANFLVQRKRSKPVVLNVLREVTEVLPDDTWLQQLQINGAEVKMVGSAPSASTTMQTIDDSSLLGETGFSSAVTTDSRTGKERFNIQATVLATQSDLASTGSENFAKGTAQGQGGSSARATSAAHGFSSPTMANEASNEGVFDGTAAPRS